MVVDVRIQLNQPEWCVWRSRYACPRQYSWGSHISLPLDRCEGEPVAPRRLRHCGHSRRRYKRFVDVYALVAARSTSHSTRTCRSSKIRSPDLGNQRAGNNPVQPMALEVTASVTKMSRKLRKTVAILRPMATNEGESRLREFVPTC